VIAEFHDRLSPSTDSRLFPTPCLVTPPAGGNKIRLIICTASGDVDDVINYLGNTATIAAGVGVTQ